MLRALPIVVLVLAGLAGAILLWPRDEAASTPSTGVVSLIGDSLNVGIEPYLADALPGWVVRTENEVGRASAEGIDVIERERASLGRVVAVSLGTNDPQDDPSTFRGHVRRALGLVGQRCVVWVRIWRNGPNEAFNDVLAEEAQANRLLTLVEWDSMLVAHPEWLAADGVHATPDGYRARTLAVAAAVRSCERRP